MIEKHAPVQDVLLGFTVTYEAPLSVQSEFFRTKMAEETNIQRDLHMFALHYIGMATPAVESYSSPVFGKMRFVIKNDVWF